VESIWTSVILPNFEGTPDGRYISTMQVFWDVQMANPEIKMLKIHDVRGRLAFVQRRLMYVVFDPLSQPERTAYECLNRVLRVLNFSYPERYTDFFAEN